MKTNWKIKKLGEICKIEIGKTPSRSNHKLWDKEKITENVWLSIRDLSDAENKVISDSREYVSNKGAESLNIVKKGTLLVSFKLTLGRLAFTGKDLYTNEAIASLSIKNEKEIDKNYLYQYLSFFDWDKATKGDVKIKGKTLNKAKLKEIEIVLPPLSEQREIVIILNKAFSDITKAKDNAEKNLKNAKELFESILIKIFFDGVNTKKWSLEKLEKYNKVVVGYVGPISKDYTNEEDGVLLLSTKNINNKGITLEKLTRINKQFHFKNKKSQLVSGDIIVARHGNSGQSAVIPESIKEAHALNVIVIKKSTILSSEYLCFLLNSGVLEKISSSKAGSVQEIINTSVIKDLVIPVPDIKEQKEIVINLEEISIETKKLETIYQNKIKDLEELKKSILQKAFNGELC